MSVKTTLQDQAQRLGARFNTKTTVAQLEAMIQLRITELREEKRRAADARHAAKIQAKAERQARRNDKRAQRRARRERALAESLSNRYGQFEETLYAESEKLVAAEHEGAVLEAAHILGDIIEHALLGGDARG